MIQKKTVIQLIDDWIERLGDGYADDVVETVLLIVKRKVEGLAEEDKWIPVKRAFPEPAKRYLVSAIWIDGDYVSKPEVYDAVFGSDGKWHTTDYKVVSYEVIAWQPLPEPYKPPKPSLKESMMKHFTKVE